MESNNLFNLVQQGFRAAIGATTSVVETLQDPQKREQTLSELNEEWQKKSQEWVQKGEVTEKEARRMIDNFLQKKGQSSQSNIYESNNDNMTNASNSSSQSFSTASEIQELNEAIVSLRIELEKLNQSKS